jgi:hypothetical protein
MKCEMNIESLPHHAKQTLKFCVQEFSRFRQCFLTKSERNSFYRPNGHFAKKASRTTVKEA